MEVIDSCYNLYVLFLFSSSLTLYQHSNRRGQRLVLTDDDSSLTNNGFWNDQTSSLRVTGPCQWILFLHGNFAGSSSVVGPGTRDYEFGYGSNGFRLPNDAITSVRCLPAVNSENLVLFQNYYYGGRKLVLSSSNPDLRNGGFNEYASSLVITGGTWELHSATNYLGSSVRLGKGLYPTANSLRPIANDDLSSVRLIGKGIQQSVHAKVHPKSHWCEKV